MNINSVLVCSAGVITVVVWTIMRKSVAFPPSQRDVIAVKASHTWWPSVPTRGRCLPPRLRTPTAPPPQLSPRRRRAGRARRPLRRKPVSAALTPSAGGRVGTETSPGSLVAFHLVSTEPGAKNHLPHMPGSPERPSRAAMVSVDGDNTPACVCVFNEQSQQPLTCVRV